MSKCMNDNNVVNVPTSLVNDFRDKNSSLRENLINFQNELKKMEGNNKDYLSYGNFGPMTRMYNEIYAYLPTYFCQEFDDDSDITATKSGTIVDLIYTVEGFFTSYEYAELVKEVDHPIDSMTISRHMEPYTTALRKEFEATSKWAQDAVKQHKMSGQSTVIKNLNNQVQKNTQQIAINSEALEGLDDVIREQVENFFKNAENIRNIEALIGEIDTSTPEQQIMERLEESQDALSFAKDIISVTADLETLKPFTAPIKDIDKVLTLGNMIATFIKRYKKG